MKRMVSSKTEELPLNNRRLTIELTTEQVRFFHNLPYGSRKPLMQAVVDDLIEACKEKKFEVIGAIIARRLQFQVEVNRLMLHNATEEGTTNAAE